MRVVHVQRTAGVSGSERHLLALLPGLAASGIDVELVVLERPGGEAFTAAAADVGIPARGVPVSGRAISFGAVRAIRDAARTADVLHTHLIHADVAGALAARRLDVALVSSVHSTAQHYERPLGRRAAAWAGGRARRVIAISDHVHRFVVDAGLAPADRVVTVHYGLDVDAWPKLPIPDDRWGWSRDEVVFVLASRLVADKGHDPAVRATRQVAERHPAVRLAIVGDGPLRPDIERLVDELGAQDVVQLLGYQADMQAVYAAADVVLFPTGRGFGEGFGLVNLEAMASARPVIGSRVASVPEIVEDGVTGLLVPPDDAGGLADAMAELASDPVRRGALGEAGRARAASQFSLERMVSSTVAVYEGVLGG
jgi:glycosyltransferase involved in cell wall biosynthesis